MTCLHHDITGRFNYFRSLRTTEGENYIQCSQCLERWIPEQECLTPREKCLEEKIQEGLDRQYCSHCDCEVSCKNCGTYFVKEVGTGRAEVYDKREIDQKFRDVHDMIEGKWHSLDRRQCQSLHSANDEEKGQTEKRRGD